MAGCLFVGRCKHRAKQHACVMVIDTDTVGKVRKKGFARSASIVKSTEKKYEEGAGVTTGHLDLSSNISGLNDGPLKTQTKWMRSTPCLHTALPFTVHLCLPLKMQTRDL